MTYDPKQFPFYGKIPFPGHLKPGERVWIREGIEGGWNIGGEFEPPVQTRGPLTVVAVEDRPNNVTPLVRVREPESGKESALCASLLMRSAPRPIKLRRRAKR